MNCVGCNRGPVLGYLCPACKKKLASSDSEPSPEPAAREAAGERSTVVDGVHASEASGVGSEMKAEGGGKPTQAAEPTEAHPVEREVTAANGLPAAGEPRSELCFAAISEAIRFNLGLIQILTHRLYPPHEQIRAAEDRLDKLTKALCGETASVKPTPAITVSRLPAIP